MFFGVAWSWGLGVPEGRRPGFIEPACATCRYADVQELGRRCAREAAVVNADVVVVYAAGPDERR